MSTQMPNNSAGMWQHNQPLLLEANRELDRLTDCFIFNPRSGNTKEKSILHDMFGSKILSAGWTIGDNS